MMESSEDRLPSNWIVASVGDLFKVLGGGTPDTTKPDYWKGDVPWITSADIGERHQITPRRFISNDAISNSATNLVPRGSVVVVTRVGLGKVGLTEHDLCFSQDNQALVFNPVQMEPRFVLYQIGQTVDVFHRMSRGTTISGVTKKQLVQLDFKLAPLQEQHRIVEEIEKQFTRLDAAVAALKRVQANLKRYRPAVLKAACEGRLVPTEAELARREGRSYEPASELLKRILGIRPTVEVIRESNLNNLPSIPEGWAWTTISVLRVDGPQNGLYLPKSKYGSGVPILRIDDFQNESSRRSEELQLVDASAQEVETYSLRPTDLVINRVNSPSHLGKVLLVEKANIPSLFESNMMRLHLSEFVSSAFVTAYLRSVAGRSRLTAHAKWAVNQASINQGDVLGTPIPIPPMQEQIRIMAEVERMVSVASEINSEIQINLKRSGKLRHAILKRAFEGKLVPQDPSDEPASVLLERIRAEREAKHNISGSPSNRKRGAKVHVAG